MKVCIFTAIPLVLIQKQPSLSASLVLIAILAVEVFAAGLDYKYISIAFAVIIPILLFVIWDVLREDPILIDKILRPHQITRILTFLKPEADPDNYYQTLKSISAIGSGPVNG